MGGYGYLYCFVLCKFYLRIWVGVVCLVVVMCIGLVLVFVCSRVVKVFGGSCFSCEVFSLLMNF